MIDQNVEVGSVVEEVGSEGCASVISDAEHVRPEKREWFIRNMPSDLVEQVNGAAKAGRMTIAEWLSEKLRHILAEETGMLDDGARITRLEKEVEDAHQRIDSLCEHLNAEREAKARSERGRSADELRERWKELTGGRR
jgi:hypothetical protein